MTKETLHLIEPQYGPASTAAPTAPHVSARRDQTVLAFMDDLRKFVLHRSLESTLRGPQAPAANTPVASLAVHIRELYGWNGWSLQGRQFLDTLLGEELLEQALAPYRSHVTAYFAWVAQWQAAVHRVALEELSELQRGFNHPELPAPQGPVFGEDQARVPESWVPSAPTLRAI